MALRRKESTGTNRPKRLGVYLDKDTYDDLFLTARRENTSATALVEHLIQTYLRKRPGGKRSTR
jgi:hypothetical protein